MTYFPHTFSTAARIDAVARELARLIERITDAAAVARGLADATDWQAEAARAFHERAAAWAGAVSGLTCAAESVRLDVVRARDRAAVAEALIAASLPPHLVAGGMR